MCTGTSDSESEGFIPVDQNVSQVIVQAELQKTVTGACDCPSVLVMMIYDQAMGMGTVTESAVVVRAATGAVLDSQNIIVVVHHLVKQCGADLFDGASQGACSDVDLVGSALLADPSIIPQREVAVSFGGGLDGDGGS